MKVLPLVITVALATFTNFSQDPIQKPVPSQPATPQTEVDLELKQTASSYKTGDFADAQQHADRAVLLDPANKTAAIFLARVMHQRYKPGDDTPQNVQVALGAIAAYQRLLTLDYQNEEAYKAVAVLYAAIHQDELLKAWVLQRALDPQVSNERRAEAYAVLAGKDWDCSFKFTELPEQKLVEGKGSKAVVVWKMPKDRTAFARAQECVKNGFEMTDLALSLNRESETAWSYKTNLLFEAAKLAQMEGLDPAKADYERQAKEASVEARRLAEKRRRAEESVEAEPSPRPTPSPASLH